MSSYLSMWLCSCSVKVSIVSLCSEYAMQKFLANSRKSSPSLIPMRPVFLWRERHFDAHQKTVFPLWSGVLLRISDKAGRSRLLEALPQEAVSIAARAYLFLLFNFHFLFLYPPESLDRFCVSFWHYFGHIVFQYLFEVQCLVLFDVRMLVQLNSLFFSWLRSHCLLTRWLFDVNSVQVGLLRVEWIYFWFKRALIFVLHVVNLSFWNYNFSWFSGLILAEWIRRHIWWVQPRRLKTSMWYVRNRVKIVCLW